VLGNEGFPSDTKRYHEDGFLSRNLSNKKARMGMVQKSQSGEADKRCAKL
jgi:hypothetical protein